MGSADEFDKYRYYMSSVQSPEEDMKFVNQAYRDARGPHAVANILREDFCGTFANCTAWVKQSDSKIAYGVDLDPEPLAWGRKNHFDPLTSGEKERLKIIQENVQSPELPFADVICGLNFSYFLFKERQELKRYFTNAFKTLNKDGIFLLDCFGGSSCMEPNEEETEYEDEGYSYYWDQDMFDPLNNHALFHIHFKRNGEPKREKVFSYDWRMWSVPEIRDLMIECGFTKVNTYWEGTTEDGEGDGEYVITEKGDDCESWVSYIVAVK
jgi:hypothetical protein